MTDSEGNELTTLRAIVRDLAEGGQPTYENDWGVEGCVLCDGYENLGGGVSPTPHDPACSWRRAVEWVVEHPVGTNEGSEE